MGFDTEFKPVLRFMVCSDVHYKPERTVERERMEKALRRAYELSESQEYNRLDAVYVVGDFANHGDPVEMQAFKDTLDAYIKGDTVVNCSIASHEFGFNGEEGAKQRLKDIFGMDASTHRIINGFHFVSIGCTRGCHFDDAERAFAMKALEEARLDNPRKPVFVFQHPHVQDTVYGSIAWGEDEMTRVYINYPQIITFSGHSHAPINDPRSIHQKHFTSLGTGTLSYFEMDEFDKNLGTCPPGVQEAAQMLLVEADKDGRVRVYPYDLITDNFFPYTWKIDEPWNPDSYEYTDARYRTTEAPWFEENTPMDVTVDGNDITVVFGQAKVKKDYVNGYEAALKSKDGLTVRKFNLFSEYYLYNMPQKCIAKFTDVPAGEYYVEIYANSFWKTTSEKPLRSSIFSKN